MRETASVATMCFDEFQIILKTIFAAWGIGFLLRKLIPAWKRYKEIVSVTKDIACDEPHWLFGHLLRDQPTEKAFYNYVGLLEKFPKCQPMWLGPFTVYIQGYFPDFMKTVLNTDEPKDDFGYRFLRPWVGDGLLTSSGSKWKRNRRLLTPLFHFDVLRNYLKCMNDATSELLDKWFEQSEKASDNSAAVEMFHDIGRMTLDNLLRCILSKESGCQRSTDNSYVQAVHLLTEITMNRLFNPFYHFDTIFYLSPMGRRYKKALQIAHDYTETAIKERQDKSNSSSPKGKEELDFLDMLLLAKDEQGTGLTHQEICDEVDTFVFEGHDTVSSAISWAMYNLAAYPDYQEKCRKEVANLLGPKEVVEWEDLSKFKFLTMFIKESMRLYPPVFSIGRQVSKPLLFDRGFGKDLFNCSKQIPPNIAKQYSKVFPKSTKFAMSIFMLHHNPHIWENPMTFYPERFTAENVSKRSTHAYLPFSAGPRNCIGQHFAMNEIKVVLARTLSNFRITLHESFPKPELGPHLILRAKNGIHLKLYRLSKS